MSILPHSTAPDREVSQFAKAAGAQVIATTSSNAKADILKELGADHVINYTTDPGWGETAKSLTADHVGVQYIVEVGGPASMAQSLKAVKPGGIISVVGFLGGYSKHQPSFLEVLLHACIARGVAVGSRRQFEDMSRAIDACGIKPLIDERVFEFEEVKEAYQYLWDQKHFVGPSLLS
jgi:NADPH:quinone reductase-like Zn-dependent oxidoreductase